MSNLTLNKPTTASNECAPFIASCATDGITNSPLNRWICSVMPAWLRVDLQNTYYIDRWTVTFMGAVGWATNYNVRDFKLMGSLDGSSWFDLDTVTNNSGSTIDRTIMPARVRYLRVYITKGLGINNGVASIVEFQAFEAQNTAFLSGLVPGIGALSPAFASNVFNYSVNVGNTVAVISFTPLAVTGITIKINGVAVNIGQKSAAIPLNVGNNMITADVTASNGMKNTYTINVVRDDGAGSLLSGLSVFDVDLESNLALTPAFTSSTFNYTGTMGADSSAIKIIPYANNKSASIQVNSISVPAGQQSQLISLSPGTNIITVVVTSSGVSNTYRIVITKTS
ncbi:MAG TPA: cadherin-like beta sandwich domain-containing protein [Bacteroidales bacterium]|nr:cadherin-like beta sandwich domain-containing protein [Bacteroidales bacterium]